MKIALWWIRRDLRLHDNQALNAALAQAENVIPVYILDPKIISSPVINPARLGFLVEGLRALEHSLQRHGSGLIVRQGEPSQVLAAISHETTAGGIFAEADHSPYARRRDQAIQSQLPLTLTPGVTIHPPERLLKVDGTAYSIFTPFRRMWLNLPSPGKPLPAPEKLTPIPVLPSLPLLSLPWQTRNLIFTAGEAEAQRRLSVFLDSGIHRYAEERDRLDLESTSGLSPYLRFGMISARQAAWSTRQVEIHAMDSATRRGAEAWLNELIWREFYTCILLHFPFVLYNAFHPEFGGVPWRRDPKSFTAWKEGRTGYPVVDAAMRQLNATGWMHNRARMIVASFLVKDLLIDWRLGARFFMQQLVDGDPAANNGGWQWSAGTGTDAAPYFRVFNPVLQGKKFDPRGNFVRHWIPELANVPDAFVHTPWKMPGDMQHHSGCIIGRDYPTPLVDHALARQRFLDTYRNR
jgi:deoxyribodipyrimidine photo-lyase